MKTIQIVLVTLLVVSAVVSAAPQENSTAPSALPSRPLSPMMTEITAAMEVSQAAVAELTRGLDHASSVDEVMAIQREVTRLKFEARLETFRIQLRYAVAEGRTEHVVKLESLLEAMTSPRSVGVPMVREPAVAGGR